MAEKKRTPRDGESKDDNRFTRADVQAALDRAADLAARLAKESGARKDLDLARTLEAATRCYRTPEISIAKLGTEAKRWLHTKYDDAQLGRRAVLTADDAMTELRVDYVAPALREAASHPTRTTRIAESLCGDARWVIEFQPDKPVVQVTAKHVREVQAPMPAGWSVSVVDTVDVGPVRTVLVKIARDMTKALREEPTDDEVEVCLCELLKVLHFSGERSGRLRKARTMRASRARRARS